MTMMKMSVRCLLVAGMFCAAGVAQKSGHPAEAGAALAWADRVIVYPADSGALNVKDYGAKGDGQTDDTAAILKAISETGIDTRGFGFEDKIVFFPKGIYKISAPLIKRYADGGYASGIYLMGESRESVTLKLADHAPGYDKANAPKAMIFMTSRLLDSGGPYGGGKKYPELGEGNDAYWNSVENMTVDVGKGNPGAIGIDYLSNNGGALRNVEVRTTDTGAVGIAMTRKWIGPALVEHVTVNGFDVGIDVANTQYSITMDGVRLFDQKKAALQNNKNMVTVKDIEVKSGTLGIANVGADGLIMLVRGHITAPAGKAIQNAGVIVFHGTKMDGYQAITGGALPGDLMEGFMSGQTHWKDTKGAWGLPIPEFPNPAAEPSDKWVSITKFGAVGIATTDAKGAVAETPTDALPAFKQAFATGASTVYLPHGIYYISQNLDIPATVKRIVGMKSTLRVFQVGGYRMDRSKGMIRVAARTNAPLMIQNLTFDNSNFGTQLAVEHSSQRDVILRDIVFAGTVMVNRAWTGGREYFDNTACGGCVNNIIAGPNMVAARQLNLENCRLCINNQGSPLWIMGAKTEGFVSLVSGTAGSQTELLGGLFYMVRPNTKPEASLFFMQDSRLTASFVEEVLVSPAHYINYITDTTTGTAQNVPEGGIARDPGGHGEIMPMLQDIPPGWEQPK
ncbi:MAG TPA: glycoside hydrolase family 55 protein [Acidobacteriaceae bacterium]